ncbi:MAG: glycosyltransferase family 2 protein [Chitinophagaceae bacterium]|nr:glycosyltransferase family 2 protein [Chitinophagaceae bacterium]
MVSVLIPCYNYGYLIADTLQAISRQTYAGWEVIIVDDGSTDNTASVVQPFIEKDSRISYYRQANAGPSEARKKAIGYAKGEFIQFLDADDLLEDRKFEIQLRVFASRPEADVVYGSVRYFRDNPHDKTKWTYTYWGKNKEWMPGISGKGPAFYRLHLKEVLAL